MIRALGDRRGAIWSAVFWAVLGVASFVLGVQSSLGQLAEESVLDAARFTTDPPAPLNLMSAPSLLIAMAVTGVIALAAHGWRRAIGVAAASAAAIAASQLLKLRVLERPQLLDFSTDNTFPSGHMTAFTVVVIALVWAVPGAVRAAVAVGGAVLLSVVAWQLLAYGWHRPSDVFGGIALGVLTFALAAVIRPLTSGRAAPLVGLWSTLFVLASLLLVVGALILVAIAAAKGESGLMLTAGQFGAIGASALAARTAMRLAQPRR